LRKPLEQVVDLGKGAGQPGSAIRIGRRHARRLGSVRDAGKKEDDGHQAPHW
jgi:hypothetical protein